MLYLKSGCAQTEHKKAFKQISQLLLESELEYYLNQENSV